MSQDRMSRELIIIDFSSLAVPIWMMSSSEPDPNAASTKMVDRVRALASGNPFVAVVCDSGKSFRNDISQAYKANRPPSDEPMRHQMRLAQERLREDGFPVWSVKGFEADDIAATCVARALEQEDTAVLVVTADKDLLQLVGPRVRAMSARDGSILDEAAVLAKFSVRPDQIRDYLTLVGDSSDNVKGATGIGPKKAAELLQKYGTLDAVYADLRDHGTNFKPAMATALKDFLSRVDETRALVTLRTDVDVPFETIAAERVAKNIEPMPEMEEEMNAQDSGEPVIAGSDFKGPTGKPQAEREQGESAGAPSATSEHIGSPEASKPTTTALAIVNEPEVLAPVQYERQLDPRSLKDARMLATDMFQSRLFSAYGTPQGVLSTVMLGRELGLPAMAALRSVHVIEGRHALSAALMVALVLKSGFAEYFEPVSFDDKQATFETKRKGARNPVVLTHTIEMAKTAGLLKPNSNWEKIPTDMLVARAQSRLCRMVYPDVVGGLYTPDELRDSANNAKVA